LAALSCAGFVEDDSALPRRCSPHNNGFIIFSTLFLRRLSYECNPVQHTITSISMLYTLMNHIICTYYRLHTSAASSLKKKKNPTTHKRPAKKNPRIAARPLDELIRPLWAESKGFQYIP
jgi:hypothetical protein